MHMREEAKRFADHFALLWLAVLEEVIFGANHKQGDWQGHQNILVRVSLSVLLPHLGCQVAGQAALFRRQVGHHSIEPLADATEQSVYRGPQPLRPR